MNSMARSAWPDQRHSWIVFLGLIVAGAVSACSGASGESVGAGQGTADGGGSWLSATEIVVSGHGVDNDDCRSAICRHNENTDLISWNDALWLVHRTAKSQVLGPNSSLHVYRSTDQGRTFVQTAQIPAPSDRDIRDPHFYVVGNELRIKALTRLPVISVRDSDVDTVSTMTASTDGIHWSSL